MVLTHRFGSPETLARARYWLARNGFEVNHADPNGSDDLRLSVHLTYPQSAAAFALINALEGSDPDGWPALFDKPKAVHVRPAPVPTPDEHAPGRWPIHWQSRAEEPSDPISSDVYEHMFETWE